MKVRKIIYKLILLTMITLVLVVIVILSLNYAGFCFAERRFLSDEEKIKIAIKYILSTYPPVIDLFEERNEIVVKIGRNTPADPIRYDSMEDFLSQNPSCCKITKTMERSGYTVRLEHKLLGSVNTFVELKFKVKYVDEKGIVRTAMKTRYVAVSNCGHPWSGT